MVRTVEEEEEAEEKRYRSTSQRSSPYYFRFVQTINKSDTEDIARKYLLATKVIWQNFVALKFWRSLYNSIWDQIVICWFFDSSIDVFFVEYIN